MSNAEKLDDVRKMVLVCKACGEHDTLESQIVEWGTSSIEVYGTIEEPIFDLREHYNGVDSWVDAIMCTKCDATYVEEELKTLEVKYV